MAGFVVVDFEEGGVGCVGEAPGGCKSAVFETFDALLVEGEDDPFCRKGVLEK